KIKTYSFYFSSSLDAVAAPAPPHHGFYWQPGQDEIDAFENGTAKTSKTTNCWFTPELIMPIMENGVMSVSNIYLNNKTDMIVRRANANNNAENLTGVVMNSGAVFEDGYLVVTVPSELEYPYFDEYTGTGTVVFHLSMGSAPSRINDTDNTLSATGDEAYLKDVTKAYVGVKAPAGASVKAYFSTPNIGPDVAEPDNWGDVMRTMAFDFGTLTSDSYVELTSGDPYNSMVPKTPITTLKGKEWPNGYCVKFVDVAVYGVKAGDKVGFGGLQTLHEGWTPKTFVEGWSGVDAIGVDNADAPVEYFNIQGVRVSADNLTPGLYIKRQGTEATKVLVK
ncbi:MAG: hypothetical protein K2L90_02900, partial [Muribaculaceae bacterium]|nr:hypothetical protein [Muribaculaceae bacterium]